MALTRVTGLQVGDGSIKNIDIADSTITDVKIASANKDGAAGTPSMRTLGTGALQSAAGNHTHAGVYQPIMTNPVTGTGSDGQVSFWNGTNSQTSDSGLMWDNVNKKLKIGNGLYGLSPITSSNDGDILTLINLTNGSTDSPISRKLSWWNTSPIESASIDVPDARQNSNGVAMIFNTRNTSNILAERARFNNAGRFLLNQTTDNLTDIAQFNGSAISTAWKVKGGLVSQYQTGTGTLVDFNTGVRNATLTGYVSGAGTVSATDNVLKAIQKLNGNDALKAPLANPALTGTPTAPTAPAGTNTTQIATTAFVQANARPYKVYSALLTQFGTNAPVATVLENSLGVTITWSRSMSGQYFGTASSSIFSSNKFVPFSGRTNINTLIRLDYFTPTEVFLGTATVTGAASTTFSDSLITNASIEIRVYN